MNTTTQPQQPRKRWPRRHPVLTGIGALAVIGTIGGIASGSGGGKPAASTATAPPATTAPAAHQQAVDACRKSLDDPYATIDASGTCVQPSDDPAWQQPATPAMTASQQQAVTAAQGYLADGQGFSDYSLDKQLTSKYGDGFSEADARFAISYLHPDWNAQAMLAAKGYLADGQGFSRSSLIEQLTSQYGDGFTEAQAEYAVDKAGL